MGKHLMDVKLNGVCYDLKFEPCMYNVSGEHGIVFSKYSQSLSRCAALPLHLKSPQ